MRGAISSGLLVEAGGVFDGEEVAGADGSMGVVGVDGFTEVVGVGSFVVGKVFSTKILAMLMFLGKRYSIRQMTLMA